MKRKEFIRKSTLLSGAMISGMGVSSCSLFEEPEMELCLASEIKEGSFRTFVFNRKKIHVRRVDGILEVISLTCTHKRCTVSYQEEDKIFACPCHEGTYDFQGRVIDGPPPKPLRRFRYESREGILWVLNETAT